MWILHTKCNLLNIFIFCMSLNIAFVYFKDMLNGNVEYLILQRKKQKGVKQGSMTH